MKRALLIAIVALGSVTASAQVKVWPPESLMVRPSANLGRLANAKTSYQTVYMNIVDCDKMIAGMKSGTLVPVLTVKGVLFTKPSASKVAKTVYADYTALKAALSSKADEYTRAVQDECGWPSKDRAVQWLLTPNR